MSADRSEKMVVTRDLAKTVVKITITEDGVTVNYSVKTYESVVDEAVKTARAGALRLLEKVNPK